MPVGVERDLGALMAHRRLYCLDGASGGDKGRREVMPQIVESNARQASPRCRRPPPVAHSVATDRRSISCVEQEAVWSNTPLVVTQTKVGDMLAQRVENDRGSRPDSTSNGNGSIPIEPRLARRQERGSPSSAAGTTVEPE